MADIVKELGLSVGVFLLCFYMVKEFINRMAGSIEKLITQNEVFMSRVRAEHDAACKQHEEMIKVLGRINGYHNKD